VYPTEIFDPTLKSLVSPERVDGTWYNDLAQQITAIETALGLTIKGTEDTLSARLTTIEGDIITGGGGGGGFPPVVIALPVADLTTVPSGSDTKVWTSPGTIDFTGVSQVKATLQVGLNSSTSAVGYWQLEVGNSGSWPLNGPQFLYLGTGPQIVTRCHLVTGSGVVSGAQHVSLWVNGANTWEKFSFYDIASLIIERF